ncbi:DUF3440 domain-containing protein [Enterococcus hirae]|uniref:DUF3440 domain-containing protein n=1 Tax=Enterococcus hirae TaxID=1354 RepID=UPI0028699257|nr:DUF3440 domain-containing protein [Enterococcus hirae]
MLQKTDNHKIKFYDCPDDVSIKHFRLVLSYKRMCITILKNDTFVAIWVFLKLEMNYKKRETMVLWK